MFRFIEAGSLHFAEASEGAVLVCLNLRLQGGGETQEADAHLEKDYGNGDQAGDLAVKNGGTATLWP